MYGEVKFINYTTRFQSTSCYVNTDNFLFLFICCRDVWVSRLYPLRYEDYCNNAIMVHIYLRMACLNKPKIISLRNIPINVN